MVVKPDLWGGFCQGEQITADVPSLYKTEHRKTSAGNKKKIKVERQLGDSARPPHPQGRGGQIILAHPLHSQQVSDLCSFALVV